MERDVGKARAFDYIVIGAGSAGAVVASRLSEDPNVSVALLEAGGALRHPLIRMPLAFVLVQRDPRFTWQWVSEPEPAMNGRTMDIVAGRGLGGSSSVNGLIYTRGNRLDYDLWCQSGLRGWGYADVLPYFKRLENSWRGETRYHGGSGPISVEQVGHTEFIDDIYDALEQAAVAAGYPVSADLHGDDVEGISRIELSVDRGRRSSTARGYLDPARARPNLTIFTGANARKILFAGRHTEGVEFVLGGRAERLYCRNEVILSAGTISSPHLLMLSGIGPADHLREVGIEPIVDLPGVGQNLSDHPRLVMSWKAAHKRTLLRYLRWDRAALGVVRWAFTKGGPMSFNGAYSNHYIRTRAELTRADVQLVGLAIGIDAQPWFPAFTDQPTHRFSQLIYGLHPESRGEITLQSSDPDRPPRLLYNLLSVPSDMDSMVAACRAARGIYQKSPQADLIAEEILPGPQAVTDEDLRAFIRQTATPGIHPVGTCQMSIGSQAVVDAELKVRGVTGLRIADASIFPDLPGGNINIPTIMVGEKAADMIRGRMLPPVDFESVMEATPNQIQFAK